MKNKISFKTSLLAAALAFGLLSVASCGNSSQLSESTVSARETPIQDGPQEFELDEARSVRFPSAISCRTELENGDILVHDAGLRYSKSDKYLYLSIQAYTYTPGLDHPDGSVGNDYIISEPIEPFIDVSEPIRRVETGNNFEMAEMWPSGFVLFNYETSSIVFGLPTGPEIAYTAQNCMIPESGIIISN